MLFFLDLGGDVKRIDAERIYQGTNDGAKIQLITPITPTSTSIEVAFQYPNGLVTTYYPMAIVGRYSLQDLDTTDIDNYGNIQVYMWQIDLLSNVTTNAGTVVITFKVTKPANVEAYATTELFPETGESGVYYVCDGVYYEWQNGAYVETTDTIDIINNTYKQIATSPCPFTVEYAALPSPPEQVTTSEIEQILTLLNEYYSTIADKIIDNTEDIEGLDTRLTTAEGDIEDLQIAVGDWEDLLDAINGRVTDAEEQVASMQETVDDVNNRMTTVEGEFDDLQEFASNMVAYTEQTKTDEEKAQARENIDAQKAFTDGSAAIAWVAADDVVKLKAGITQSGGKIANNSYSDVALAKVAKTGSYNDLTDTPTIPTVNNGTLTIQAEGVSKGTFKANQATNATINITAADLGITSALKYIGEATVNDGTGLSYGKYKLTSLINSKYYAIQVTDTGAKEQIPCELGDVFTYGGKEYVCTTAGLSGTNVFMELGDESSYAKKTVTVTGTGALSGGGTLEQNRTITHTYALGSGQGKTNQAYRKIAVDDYGHVTGMTIGTSEPAVQDGETLTLVTTGEKYAWSNGASDKMEKNNPVGTGSMSMNRKSDTTVGNYSTTLGYNNTASGINSVAEGNLTSATETDTHAEGFNTTASGRYSHVEGYRTTANHRSQHVFGEYNVLDSNAAAASARGDYVEIVGNGDYDNNTRSNARTLDWSGNEYIAGDMTINKTTLANQASSAISVNLPSSAGTIALTTEIPTKVSDLQNDSGYITSSDVTSVNGQTGAVTLTASDVGALSSSTTIPTKTSDLTNDSGYITSSALSGYVQTTGGSITGNLSVSGTLDGATIQENGTALSTKYTLKTDFDKVVDGTTQVGDAAKLNGQQPSYYLNYNNLSNTPTIPTATSDLTNDSGFITSADLPTVNNNTITLQKNGTTVESFTLNQNSDETINITIDKADVGLSNVDNVQQYSASNPPPYPVTNVEVNGTSVVSGGVAAVAVPTKVSELQNDSGFTTNAGTVTSVGAGTGLKITGTSTVNPTVNVDTDTHKLLTNNEYALLATKQWVNDEIDDLPEPMVFKGTLGTNGTITALPTAGSTNVGFVYKVITAGTYASETAQVGDTFVCAQTGTTTYAWVLIPSGDDVEDTWRQINVNGTQLLGSGISTGVVNFKNGSNVTITGSGNDITIAATQPTVNNGTLTIQKNGTDVATFTANQSGNSTANISVPTKTSDLTNDSNYAVTNADNNFTERQTIGTSVNDGDHNIGLIVKNVRKQCYVQFRGKTDNGSGSDLTFGEIGVNSSGTPIYYNEVGSKASNIVLHNINNNFSAGQTIDHNIALDHSTATDRCLLFRTNGVDKAQIRCSGTADGALVYQATSHTIRPDTNSSAKGLVIDSTNKIIKPETATTSADESYVIGTSSNAFYQVVSREFYAKNRSYAYTEAPSSNSWRGVYRFADKNGTSFGGMNGGILSDSNAVEIGVNDKDGNWGNVRLVANGAAGASHSFVFRPSGTTCALGTSGNAWNGIWSQSDINTIQPTPNFNGRMSGDTYNTTPSATQSAQYLARDKNGNWMGGMRYYHTTGDKSQVQLIARSPKTSTYSTGVMLEQDASATDNNQAGKCRFIPFGDGRLDLGTSVNQWRNIYGVNVYATSDRRLKENIKDAELDCKEIIDKLQIKEFNFKADEDKNVVVGAIAQELLELLPEKYRATLVSGSEDTSYSINEGKLLFVAIGALKDEMQKTKELEERLKAIEDKLGV